MSPNLSGTCVPRHEGSFLENLLPVALCKPLPLQPSSSVFLLLLTSSLSPSFMGWGDSLVRYTSVFLSYPETVALKILVKR